MRQCNRPPRDDHANLSERARLILAGTPRSRTPKEREDRTAKDGYRTPSICPGRGLRLPLPLTRSPSARSCLLRFQQSSNHSGTSDVSASIENSSMWLTSGGFGVRDGQRFRAGGTGEQASQINLRYGTEPGVLLYTHISDRLPHFFSGSCHL